MYNAVQDDVSRFSSLGRETGVLNGCSLGTFPESRDTLMSESKIQSSTGVISGIAGVLDLLLLINISAVRKA